MAIYPTVETDVVVDADRLRGRVEAIFAACGMPDRHAGTVAQSLVDADLRGIHSHGVLRVPDYVGKLLDEGVHAAGEPRLVSARGAALVVDCANTLGQVGLRFAMEQAIARAGEVNVAFAAVGGSNHAGTMEYFARMALARDMIGICGTNALPTMAPWGGTDKIVGLNPLGIAVPGGAEGDFVLDTAFGATAHGKIRVYAQKNQPIPAGWAFDASGRPTTDAVAALEGLIQPIGGHKGIGMGMAIGMLSTLLSGAGYGTESGNMVDGPVPGRDGQFALVINIAGFVDPAAFRARVDTILRQVRDSRRADGVARLYVPGDMEADIEARYRHDGIVLSRAAIDAVAAAAARLGLPPDSLGAPAG